MKCKIDGHSLFGSRINIRQNLRIRITSLIFCTLIKLHKNKGRLIWHGLLQSVNSKDLYSRQWLGSSELHNATWSARVVTVHPHEKIVVLINQRRTKGKVATEKKLDGLHLWLDKLKERRSSKKCGRQEKWLSSYQPTSGRGRHIKRKVYNICRFQISTVAPIVLNRYCSVDW